MNYLKCFSFKILIYTLIFKNLKKKIIKKKNKKIKKKKNIIIK